MPSISVSVFSPATEDMIAALGGTHCPYNTSSVSGTSMGTPGSYLVPVPDARVFHESNAYPSASQNDGNIGMGGTDGLIEIVERSVLGGRLGIAHHHEG